MYRLLLAIALSLGPSALAADPPSSEVASADWLGSYDRLRIALAKDAEPDAVAAARSLTLPELAAPAAKVADAQDLAARRAAFAELSRLAILKLAADPAAPKVIAFHCTMYQGYAYWVQPKAGIENPYMGTAMPDCGEQVSLKAAAKAAQPM